MWKMSANDHFTRISRITTNFEEELFCMSLRDAKFCKIAQIYAKNSNRKKIMVRTGSISFGLVQIGSVRSGSGQRAEIRGQKS